MAQTESHIHFDISSEQALANNYKEELEVKVRALCALMNTALDDGFHTSFQIGNNLKDGRYTFTGVKLTKSF